MTVKMTAGITYNLTGERKAGIPMPVFTTLKFIGDTLGISICWYHRGSFHFKVGIDWTVSVTPDSAGRYRVDTCHLTVPVDTKWVAAHDRARLARLVQDAAEDQTLVGVAR